MNLDSEIWRAVPGWERLYEVSSHGRIRSIAIEGCFQWRRGCMLKPALSKKGYPQVRLCGLNGRDKSMAVHRVVAIAFLGPRTPGMQVNHKNGVKTDNRPENLEYVSCQENIRHAWKRGLCSADHCRGERNNKARLTAENIRTIRSIYPAQSLKRLAATFGITPQAVWHVVHRKTWQHVA